MSKYYIDYKVTCWKRIHLKDNTNMQDVIKLLEEDLRDLPDELFDEMNGFEELETLYETDSFILPENNEGKATIEVIGAEETWDNSLKSTI